jgi:hypothetical protein
MKWLGMIVVFFLVMVSSQAIGQQGRSKPANEVTACLAEINDAYPASPANPGYYYEPDYTNCWGNTIYVDWTCPIGQTTFCQYVFAAITYQCDNLGANCNTLVPPETCIMSQPANCGTENYSSFEFTRCGAAVGNRYKTLYQVGNYDPSISTTCAGTVTLPIGSDTYCSYQVDCLTGG